MKKGTVAAVFLSVAPACVLAQEDDAVVVTATRKPQPSLEIPASIDRIYGEEIHQGRAQVDLSESLGRVPGIVVQNRQNYAQDLQISSRGFGARATFGVRGIRLIADGIPATMPDGQGQAATFALGSAERVEVLRGPFSALYGNASGGVIAVDTQDGPAIPTAEASLSAGTYGAWRGALKYGGQFGRLNATAELSRFETDGYRDHSAARRDQFNAKFGIDAGESTRFTVVANSLRQPETQDPLGLTRAQVEQNPRQVVANALIFNTRKTVNQDQAGVVLDHKLSAAGSLQATLYGGERFVEQFLAIPLIFQAPDTHSGGVVNLDRGYGGGALRYFTGWERVRVSVGVEREAMSERRRGYINQNGVQGALKRDEDNEVTSTDVFAQVEWQFAERWSVHGGARHSRVRFTSDDHFILLPNNPDDSGEVTFKATTPVAGLVFRPTKLLSLYGNLGKGFETPTFVELAYRSAGTGLNFDLQASRSRHAELGAKAILPGRARLNAAVFDIETKDEIVVDTASGGRTVYKNAGRTERRGFELGADSLLPGPWSAQVAYTHLDASFRDSFVSSGVPVPAGNLIPGVPRSQIYGSLRYRASGYYAQLEALHRSRVPVNDVNGEFAEAYSIANLVGGLMQQGARWRLTEFVRVDNLTDRNYVGSVIVNDGNGRFYEPAPRRSYTLGVQAALEF